MASGKSGAVQSDIKLDTVREALRNCAVHIEPSNKRYHWNVSVRHGEAVTILPPLLDFSRDQMSRPDFQAILDDMHRRYSYVPRRATPPAPKQPISDEDATTER